jgi:hypothetical protein
MQEHGFAATVEDRDDLAPIKAQYRVPAALQSCHTAIVHGGANGEELSYVVEGHVPAAEVFRLLDEQPPVAGIGVGGMPVGSPGMEVAGVAPQPYDVVAFTDRGETFVWASYPEGGD